MDSDNHDTQSSSSNYHRFPDIPFQWQHFILSIIYLTIIPLIPLGLEFWFTGSIKTQTLALTTAIYSVTIGSSSSSRLLFGVGIVTGILFSAVFGKVLQPGTELVGSNVACYATLIILSVINILGRWNEHMAEGKKFWRF